MVTHYGTQISAHRGDTDEIWRMDRLKLALDYAAAAAEDQGRADLWDGAIISVHEIKGNLTVQWRSLWDVAWFNGLIRDAWRSLDEFVKISHECDFKAKRPRSRT